MADIQKSIVANDIKNGTLLSMCQKTGLYSTLNNAVSNIPTISDIEDKYLDRFDDISYYTLGDQVLIGG